MYHPTTRVLTVLELLQAHPCISGSQIAARLEVDVRTVRRYIVMLQDLGIPVETLNGRHGGYKLRPGFKLPPLMFTEDEVLALTLGLMAVRRLGLETAVPAVEGATAKIERVLPLNLRAQVWAIQDTLQLDTVIPVEAVESQILTTLTAAAKQCRQVRLCYHGGKGQESERIFDTYGVVRQNEHWYTAGFCHLRNDIRVFRLDRVVDVELKKEKFTPPPNFDCLNYVITSFAAIPDKWDVKVLLDISLDEARNKIPATLAFLEQQAEGVLMHTIISDLDWLARLLVNLGCQFVVKEPIELKAALAQLAEEIAFRANQASFV